MIKSRSKIVASESVENQNPAPERTPADDADNVLNALSQEINGTLWLPDGLSTGERIQRMKLALQRVNKIKPTEGIEGMLAVQMVGTHSAAMECLRRAMLPGQTVEGREQNLRHAEKLLSLYARQLEVLDKHRGKGQQKVTVEHVHIEPGGQAIVGNVEADGRQRQGKCKSPAIEYSPEVPLEAPAPVDTQNTRQRR